MVTTANKPNHKKLYFWHTCWKISLKYLFCLDTILSAAEKKEAELRGPTYYGIQEMHCSTGQNFLIGSMNM